VRMLAFRVGRLLVHPSNFSRSVRYQPLVAALHDQPRGGNNQRQSNGPFKFGGFILFAGIFTASCITGSKLLKKSPEFEPILSLAPVVVDPKVLPVANPATDKYAEIRKDIANILEKEGHDDGSLGPLLVRLAWHASGTYDKQSKTGGSQGATMRFHPESGDGANAGLDQARAALEPIKAKYPWISYADLWTLAGAVAIEEMAGPRVPWHPGRTDYDSGVRCPPVGRLPDAAKGAQHIRDVFYRMGFDDREIVALLGAHALGRCHSNRSGYDGPWTRSPTMVTNMFFQELLNNKWIPRKWSGPLQYTDEATKELMMLPADLALLSDPRFAPWVKKYAEDSDLWFTDFAAAFAKLLELGVPREERAKPTH